MKRSDSTVSSMPAVKRLLTYFSHSPEMQVTQEWSPSEWLGAESLSELALQAEPLAEEHWLQQTRQMKALEPLRRVCIYHMQGQDRLHLHIQGQGRKAAASTYKAKEGRLQPPHVRPKKKTAVSTCKAKADRLQPPHASMQSQARHLGQGWKD